MKKCTKCKIEKGLTEFHKGHSSPKTYYSWCKECKNKNSRKNNPKYKITVYGGNPDEIDVESFLDEIVDVNKVVKKYISKIRIILTNI